MCGYVGVAVAGGYLAIQGKITVGNIQSFIQYNKQFTQPINQIAQISSMLQAMVAAAERVFEFLEQPEEIETAKGEIDTSKIKGNVEFKHVNFGYDEDKTIINDFSANIKEGQKIAIVGPTGAGKTTMVKLLMRFYDVNSGEINIDGHNIKDFKRGELRKMFGMVLQDTWLFGGTVKENIKYGDKEIVCPSDKCNATGIDTGSNGDKKLTYTINIDNYTFTLNKILRVSDKIFEY